jgi:hypothetical protein
VPLAVDVVQIRHRVLQHAVAHGAVVARLLRQRGGVADDLRLAQAVVEVELKLAGLQFGALDNQTLVEGVPLLPLPLLQLVGIELSRLLEGVEGVGR